MNITRAYQVALCGTALATFALVPHTAAQEALYPLPKFSEAAARREMEAQYARMRDALKRRDIEAYMAPYSVGFVWKAWVSNLGITAEVSRAEMRETTEYEWERIESVQAWSCKIDRVIASPDEAVVLVTLKEADTRKAGGPEGESQERRVRGVVTFYDRWERSAEGWKLRYRTNVSSK